MATNASQAGWLSKVRKSPGIVGNEKLTSYQQMKKMFSRLSDHERIELLALAWFTS